MQIIHILKKSKYLIILFLLLQLTGSITGSFEPLYLQKFISAAVSGFADTPHQSIMNIFMIMAIIYIISVAAQGFGTFVMSVVSSGILKDIRNAFFHKISKLPISYFRNVSQGEFVTKFNMDISFAERFLSQTIPQLIFNILVSIAIFIILLIKCNLLLTLSGLFVAVFSSLFIIWLNKILEKIADAQRNSYSDINRVFDETVQGIDTLKIFSGERAQADKFNHYNEMFQKLSIKSGKIASIFSPFINLSLKFGNLLILVLVYYMISGKNLDRDSFLLFFFYLILFQSTINNIISTFTNIQPTLISLKRLDSLFSEEEEDNLSKEHTECKIQNLSIKAENIAFSYPNGRTIFENADISVPDRTTILIIGPSGSGKTTFINLLMRFYLLKNGSILINDKDINEYPLNDLRSMISVVTQDYFIFEETVRENLILANPSATDTEIIDAINRVNLQNWYSSLPDGLDTVLGTRGKSISGGERQRICIARALLKKSPLLILDEPFANVDKNTQNEIIKAIENLKNEKTLIIISHQPVETDIIDEHYALVPHLMTFKRIDT